jgi:glutathione peroxidase
MKKIIKRTLLGLGILFVLLTAYVFYVNRNSKDMTIRQKLLKAFYPVLMWAKGKKSTRLQNEAVQPPVSFYTLPAVANNGQAYDIGALKGKKVLLVNTASDCGYTNQYDELQQLHEKYGNRLVVLGFPANDFKEQEKGSDEEIAQFCKVNFGVSFPLMQKSTVVPGQTQNPVFQWLSDKTKNGWNAQAPAWNFSKYLVNETGQLTHYFDPAVSPMSKDVIQAIEK